MVKKEDYQNKMLSEVYKKEEILAVALFFFRRIDDIDFSIIEQIIRRRLGLSIGITMGEKPLHKSIDDLSDHIQVYEKKEEGKKPIYVYEAPIARGIARTFDESVGYFSTLGEVCSVELYKVMEEIYRDSKELTLRRLSIEPETSKQSNYIEGQNKKYLFRRGLIRVKDYRLTDKGINEINSESILNKIYKSMNLYEKSGIVDEALLSANNRGLITEKSVSLTERGRVYLLSKDYEDQIQHIKNLLNGVGCAGDYLEEYLIHIYRNELCGFYSFASKLSASDYLKYCRDKGYNDTIIESVGDSKDHGAKKYPEPTTTDKK